MGSRRVRPQTVSRAILAVILTLAVAGASPAAAQPGPIAFVQSNYAVPQSPQTTVTVLFPAAQTAGNLNVVVVGWNDTTATVSAVTDSAGNPHTLAVGPTLRPAQPRRLLDHAAGRVRRARGWPRHLRADHHHHDPDLGQQLYDQHEPADPGRHRHR